MGAENKDASYLCEIHHLLTRGKGHEAETLLAQIVGETPAQQNEIAYLYAWCAVEQKSWEETVQRVWALAPALNKDEREAVLSSGSVHRRRPACLLLLGDMAQELGYLEESIEHYQYSLRLLNERRMNIPKMRVRAHYMLGTLALRTGQPVQALIQYETALRLCDEKSEQPLSGLLFTGLCDAHAQQGNFSQALAAGQQALPLLQKNADTTHLEQLYVLLSRISLSLHDDASALTYAQDAWCSAHEANDPVRMANVSLALAEIHFTTGHMQQAQVSCQQAHSLQQRTQDRHLPGKIAFLAGKIAEARWRGQPDTITQAEEAMSRYEEARIAFAAIEDTTTLADITEHQARLLEAKGQHEQALVYWKDAYQFASKRAKLPLLRSN